MGEFEGGAGTGLKVLGPAIVSIGGTISAFLTHIRA